MRPSGAGVRNLVRSETDAYHVAVSSAMVLGAVASLGALTASLVGAALCVGAVVGVCL